ncbi:MAG: cyclic nucleotide-binding domain-containing protein, partial [Deltaproteobacteria bacterium]|nr:cyclic nucleotide-binding domain-containing protein [Kofleriaceae bacterium]
MKPAIREPVERLVGNAPFWAALPEAARRDLASHAVRRRFRRGQRLLGADDRTLLTVVVGRAELLDHEGDVIRSIDAPATVGLSLALGAPSSAELRACENGVLVSVPGDAVAATLHRHPDAAIAALLHLAAVIADLSATLDAMRRTGLEGRLRQRLRELA